MISIRKISTTDPLYPASCELRDRVLLQPIGYSMQRFCDEYPLVDPASDHFVAIAHQSAAHAAGSAPRSASGERVVGVVVLVPPHGLKSGGTPGQGKLMQMAVEPQRQGEGIGRMLVVQLEAYAFGQRKYTELFCHARLDAVGFYEKLGWVIQGEQFDEAGIGHYRMVQRAADANEVPNTRPE